MIVESIFLNNFRNYRKAEIRLDSKTNIFYGDNAQGKTNILEAAYMSGTTRSHRGSRDRDMILFGEEEGHIRTLIKKKNSDYQIDIHLKKNKPKGIAVNKVPIKKAGDLIGTANFVVFSPEDLNIIKQGPSERRRFMDMELCQISRIYYRELWEYNRTLAQRNQLIKDIYFKPELADTLDVWDEQLAKSGVKIIKEREKYIAALKKIVEEKHYSLTGGKEKLNIIYEQNSDADHLYEKIKASREKDIKLKTSTAGPHRDDLCFMVNGIDIRRFGSQGQQRTAALSLKLSEIELVETAAGESPVLLLDDVLSELDQNRQNYLMDSIGNIQTLITCTGLEDFVNNRFSINKIFYITNGRAEGKNDIMEGKL